LTIPYERYRAVIWAEEFMLELIDPKKTPRLPKSVRDQARTILRHYPHRYEMDMLAENNPSILESKDPWRQNA